MTVLVLRLRLWCIARALEREMRYAQGAQRAIDSLSSAEHDLKPSLLWLRDQSEIRARNLRHRLNETRALLLAERAR